MARFKVKKKKGDLDWLEQRRVKKQEKYDKKHSVKREVTPYPSIGDMWPKVYNEREDVC